MPRGGSRPGAGRPKKVPAAKPAAKQRAKAKPAAPVVDAEGFKTDAAPEHWPFGREHPPAPEDLSKLTPLDFLLEVMRNPEEEKGRRMQAASLAAPYCHAKAADGGKKQERQKAAEQVASNFAAGAPPRLAATGGRKV